MEHEIKVFIDQLKLAHTIDGENYTPQKKDSPLQETQSLPKNKYQYKLKQARESDLQNDVKHTSQKNTITVTQKQYVIIINIITGREVM